MNAKGFVYLIMTEEENFPFIKNDIPEESVAGFTKVPQKHRSRQFTSVPEKRQGE